MKKFILILLISINSFIKSNEINDFADPLLVIVLMVKNEAESIQKTLQPFIEAGIDSYLILDTGSTDNTIELAEELFTKHTIQHGYIVQQPFVDFATSRNYALQSAQEHFPHAGFLFMVDAEWYVEGIESLLEFCKQHYCSKDKFISGSPINVGDDDKDNHFLIKFRLLSLEYYVQRLFKPHKGIRFIGVTHEYLNVVSTNKVPDNVVIHHYRTDNSNERLTQNWLRDERLLLQEYQKNPYDLRTLFYLGQTYESLQDWEQACFWYAKRCQIIGWPEEYFMAHYQLAQMYEKMNDWQGALHFYLKAYNIRSTRAEPLVRIAQHYLNHHEYALAYMFSLQASMIPFPQDDILFINKIDYDLTRYDILSQAAWYVQEYEIGKQATLEVLKNYPNLQYVQNNLQFYI